MMPRQCRVALYCLLLGVACGRHSRTFRVLPATPAYLLQSPDSRKIPFTEVTRDYNGFERGQGWIDLRPLMELRIENAYYEKGVSRRGLAGYLGTEVAHFAIQPDGLKLLSLEPMKDRPPGDAPVDSLIPIAELNFRYYRLYFEIFLGGTHDSHGSVLLGANSPQELGQISAQLTHPETVCNAQSIHCAVFPEACSVSVEMKVVVNDKNQTVVWGSLLHEITDHPHRLTVKRRYAGRLTPIKLDARDPNVLRMPLLPGDEINWN